MNFILFFPPRKRFVQLYLLQHAFDQEAFVVFIDEKGRKRVHKGNFTFSAILSESDVYFQKLNSNIGVQNI